MEDRDESSKLAAARGGEREAFSALVAPHVAGLRELAYRMLGHAQDAEDVVQDALVRAFAAVARFEGRSTIKTWLWTIVTRACVDHLRARKRFRVEILGDGQARCEAAGLHRGMIALYDRPDVRFDVHEHIAFCVTCVARTLDPDDQAALILREVLGLDNAEAAAVLDITESVLRHRVSAARQQMVGEFDGLCALVNKHGACHQCRTLREVAPPDRRGPDAPALDRELIARLKIAREHSPRDGRAQALHDYLLRAFATFHDAA